MYLDKNLSLKQKIIKKTKNMISYLKRPRDVIWLDIKIMLRDTYRRTKWLVLAPFPYKDETFWLDRERDIEFMLRSPRWETREEIEKKYEIFKNTEKLLQQEEYKYVVRRFNGRLLYALYNNLLGQGYKDALMVDNKLFKEIYGAYKDDKVNILSYTWMKGIYNKNLTFVTSSWEDIKKIRTYYLFFLCLGRELMNDLRQRNYFIARIICEIIKKHWRWKNNWRYAKF